MSEKPQPSEVQVAPDSPEFKAAVAKAVADEMPMVLAMLKSVLGDNAVAGGQQQSQAEALAVALANLTGNANGKVYVAPEILRQRAEARERLVQLIVEARKNGHVATYKIIAKTLLNNQVVEPFWVDGGTHRTHFTEIDWDGIPNEAMEPLNDTAKQIFAEFKNSIGSIKKPVPEERYGISGSGLVVRNGAVNDSAMKRTPKEDADVGLRIHNKTEAGTAKFVHTHGTIVPPMQQRV